MRATIRDQNFEKKKLSWFKILPERYHPQSHTSDAMSNMDLEMGIFLKNSTLYAVVPWKQSQSE